MTMRNFCATGLLCVGTLVTIPGAAQTTATVPPVYKGVQTRVGGVFVTPIPNIPMTATVDISSTRILPDGSAEMRKTENHIARDSQGRIYNEMRRMVGVAYKGVPPLTSSHVYDPTSRTSVYWSPFSNVAQSTVLDPRRMRERKPFTMPEPGATETDLGESAMGGVSAHGLRRTRIIDAMEGGTRKPIEITDEYWYNEDLHLVMLERHNDPRTGEQIVAVVDVSRAEPDAKIFVPPAGYRVVDLTPDEKLREAPASVSTETLR